MIAIVDYGMGNLRSLQKAFEYLGYRAVITDRPEEVRDARRAVLPGVGAFPDAGAELRRTGMAEALIRRIAEGRPLLGVCLGMQLLFEAGTEGGVETPGLGVFPGKIVRFDHDLIVPHMGWNRISGTDRMIFSESGRDETVYFVHSFYAPLNDAVAPFAAAVCDYGFRFCAAVRKGNCVGLQFHPEKSGEAGLRMLDRFARFAE